MELIDLLTKGLGVNETQAQGGAGLLLKLAKDNLGAGDFSKVTAAVPEVDSLVKAAPSSDGGMLGGLGKMFGGGSGLGDLASLGVGFSKLGLDTGMVGKYIPIILQFVQNKGGEGVKGILEQVLK
jgi:hypothetical protein